MLDVTHQLVTSLTEEYRREQAAQQKQSNVSTGNKSEKIPYLSTEPQPNLSEVEEEVLNLKNRRSHPEELQKSFDVLSKVVEKSLFDNHWVLSDSEENDLNDALDAATLHASLQGYEVHAECGPIPNMRLWVFSHVFCCRANSHIFNCKLIVVDAEIMATNKFFAMPSWSTTSILLSSLASRAMLPSNQSNLAA